MTPSEKAKILAKVKKCLALSKSSNEHEAAAALRQAQKLMQAHGISAVEAETSDVVMTASRASARFTPAQWETSLAAAVAEAFYCRGLFARGVQGHGQWRFLGVEGSPEIAKYAFEVLLRKCKKARAEFISSDCLRCSKGTKIRRADLFCQGWVLTAASEARKLAGENPHADKIQAWLDHRFPTLNSAKVRDRNEGRDLSSSDIASFTAGALAGAKARLQHGVSEATAPARPLLENETQN